MQPNISISRKGTPPYPGHCLCGQVQYELRGEPLTYYACHCTDCQRRTGSSMRLAMWVTRSDLHVVAGEPILLEFKGSPGRPRRARACAECDTRLWAEPPDKPTLAVLLPGTLQDASQFQPVAHLWLRSALPWVTIPSGVATYETQPSDRRELVQLWQAAHGSSGQAAT
jgi:hypothetical protein